MVKGLWILTNASRSRHAAIIEFFAHLHISEDPDQWHHHQDSINSSLYHLGPGPSMKFHGNLLKEVMNVGPKSMDLGDGLTEYQ